MPDLSLIGASGLSRFYGVVTDEPLRELQGNRGRKIYREMADGDPVVAGVLFAVEMLIRQVDWQIVPADGGPAAQDAADFVDSCLRDMSLSWEDTLAEILTFLTYGWAYFEIVWKVRGGDSADPRRRSRFDDGRIGIRKLSIRPQDTLDRWVFDDEGGVQGMWQADPNTGRTAMIPIGKALLFRTKPRRANPEGVSALRGAYTPWYYKKHISRIEAIGIERDLAGLPVAGVPPEILSGTRSSDDEATYNAIREMLENVRNDEQGYVMWPLAYDDNGRPLYDFKLISSAGQRQFNTDQIIARYDQRIAMSLMADFILLGHEAVGSFALASSKTNLFGIALGGWLKSISSVINEHLLPRLLRLNGLSIGLMPSLVPGDIETLDPTVIADVVSKLAGAGAPIFPNDDLVAHLLGQLKLPVSPEGA